MPSVEVPLQFQTVGITSPAMLTTLQNLLQLYISDSTDHAAWVRALESHQRTLLPCLQAFAHEQGRAEERWSDACSIDQLRSIGMVLVNQLYTQTPANDQDNHVVAIVAIRLAELVDKSLTHKAAICARMIGSHCRFNDPDMQQAFESCQRPLEELFDTALLTRIVAVAWQSCHTEHVNKELCRRLLALGTLNSDVLLVPVDDSPQNVQELQENVSRLLFLAILKNSVQQLTGSTDPRVAISGLTTAFFESSHFELYFQGDGCWESSSRTMTSNRSIVVSASETGTIVRSSGHQRTRMDDEALAALGVDEGFAIPILMDGTPDSCAAMILVGLPEPRSLEVLEGLNSLDVYRALVRDVLCVRKEEMITLDSLDLKLRELIHEANNPLSTIQNYLKVLSMKLDPEDAAQETIETVKIEIARAADIVKSFRHIGSERSSKTGHCHTNSVVQRIGRLFQHSHPDVQFQYDLDIANEAVAMQEFECAQIVTNLVKNAVEALDAAGCIQIEVAANINLNGQCYTELIVRDTGPGVSPEVPDIFERGATTRSGDNRGEGLSIVKNLTEQSGGFVSYRTGNQGTEVRVNIPQRDSL